MIYIAKVHEIRKVKDADDAAMRIKKHELFSFQVLAWISKDMRYNMYVVPDGPIDDIFHDLAILRCRVGNRERLCEQVESIINGWIKDASELACKFHQAEVITSVILDNVMLVVDPPKDHDYAQFTCACCGERFKGNILEQLAYYQDDGYGLCSSCV